MKNILPLQEVQRIRYVCHTFNIDDNEYQINNDGSIKSNKAVYITGFSIKDLQLTFSEVKGSFGCSDNNLTSLKGCPLVIDGNFYCNDNKLTSLEYCTPDVMDFYCNNNELTSLEHCPQYTGKYFFCSNNKISTLIDCPTIISNEYDFSNNNFPDIVMIQLLYKDNMDNINLFLKYQDYYEVWSGGFNEEGFKDLIADIEEGLK